ncbi:SbmA/BacA-like family transporter [Xanthobacter autotrophicus]|uniref:SbmA/BacA-like family transporter n=1 Tax=Xanthobacter autotrophicus TaxID=280 RepID=UPI0024A64919|nr:SbmA/BacA-like family transporter [Xanthobacter autotrophicus]MDI4657459.1 ABC transporter [Xanthobacter autotrophicus]
MSLDPYLPPDQRRLVSRFWESASGFWRGRSAWRAWVLVAVMVATVLLQLWVQYRLNFWNRDFFNAIGRKDGTELWRQAWFFVPLAAASISLVIVSVWVRMTTQREWRKWLSSHLYDFWLGGGRYRRLRFMLGEHQTPEYRIAEDAKVATDVPVDLVVGLLSSVLNAITFIGVLWSVGGSLLIPAFGRHVSIPGYLVLAVVAYSVLVTAAMMFIGRHLMRVLGESKRAEADLRAIGSHLRESGEGSALPDARRDGRQIIGEALAKVIAQWRALCWQLMRMTLVSQTNLLLTPVIGLLLCMPKYLVGLMSLGEVVQAAAAFTIVQAAFNWITDSYARLAEWRSSANRVASLLLALDQVDQSERPANLDMTAGSGSNELKAQAGRVAPD